MYNFGSFKSCTFSSTFYALTIDKQSIPYHKPQEQKDLFPGTNGGKKGKGKRGGGKLTKAAGTDGSRETSKKPGEHSCK